MENLKVLAYSERSLNRQWRETVYITVMILNLKWKVLDIDGRLLVNT